MSTIKDKIKKLLNLAKDTGATEAEATTAMEMASALMLKYNIEVDPEDDDQLKVIRGNRILYGFAEPWHIVCGNTAAMLYCCKSVFFDRGEHGHQFCGRPENISAAETTMAFIIQQVEQQYKIHLPKGLSKGDRAEFRRTFKAACAHRLLSRAWDIMDSLKRDDVKAIEYTGSRALVVVQKIDEQLREAADFLEKDGVKLVKTRESKYGSGTHIGFKAAEKIQLNKQLAT